MDMTPDVHKALRSTEGHNRCGIGGGGVAFETEGIYSPENPKLPSFSFRNC